ncbi:MAG TPA: DUF2934 domain-containing protein [Burkholderiales bacterium]|nr:DUF2934 domain-containing protein [Burkholderiales bacterium]
MASTPDTAAAEGGGTQRGVPGAIVGAEERQALVRQAAYQRYLQRGGADGRDLDDWLAAEAEVDAMLGASGAAGEPARRASASAPPERGTRDAGKPGAMSAKRWAAEPAGVPEAEVQQSNGRSIARDEKMKRIIRQHPQRDIAQVESLEPPEPRRK